MSFPGAGKAGALEAALKDLCSRCEAAVRGGAALLLLTDRTDKLDADGPSIPALLATGAVHHHLIAAGLRTECSIVVDTAQAFSTHHVACLVGYGASAVCPWLALESARGWRSSPRTEALVKNGKMKNISVEEVQTNYRKALNGGLKKIISKIGVSLLSSYHGAQIFEIYGLGDDVVERCLKGTVSRVGGMTLDELAAEAAGFWASAQPGAGAGKLIPFGFFQAKPGLEYHSNNQDMSKLLHKAVGLGGGATDPEAWQGYMAHRNGRPATALRDRLRIASDRKPIPIEEASRGPIARSPARAQPNPNWTQPNPTLAGGARHRHRGPLLHRRHEPGRHQPRDARGDRHRHEPAGRPLQQRRGRRGRAAVPDHRRRGG